MRKIITSLALTVTVLSASLYSPKSEALVGVIFKKRVVKVIGGIAGTTGGVAATAGFITLATTSNMGAAILGAVALVYGGALAGIGLIVLDDNELADIEFQKLDLSDPSQYEGFTKQEAQVYNSELDLLNSIRQTIATEVAETKDTKDAEEKWLQYRSYLSPETVDIAEYKSVQFVNALKR